MNNTTVILIAIGILLAIYLTRQFLKDPMAFVGVILRNVLLGSVGLLVIDYLGKSAGIHVPLNFATAGVASVLGLPGIFAVAILQKWII